MRNLLEQYIILCYTNKSSLWIKFILSVIFLIPVYNLLLMVKSIFVYNSMFFFLILIFYFKPLLLNFYLSTKYSIGNINLQNLRNYN